MPTLTPKKGHHHQQQQQQQYAGLTATKALDRLRQLVAVNSHHHPTGTGGSSAGRRSSSSRTPDDHHDNGDDNGKVNADGRPTTTTTARSSSSSTSKDRTATTAAVVVTDANLVMLMLTSSLQGLVTVLLVYHNIRAAFFPCIAFGHSAAMIRDLSVCAAGSVSDNVDVDPFDVWQNVVVQMVQTLPSPNFCRSTLFLISALRQGHLLWKASIDRIRYAVVTRIAYLVLIGAAVTLLTAAVEGTAVSMTSGGDIHHHDHTTYPRRAAMITGSMWLYHVDDGGGVGGVPFWGWVDLVNQMTMGLTHRAAAIVVTAEQQHQPLHYNVLALPYLAYELLGTILVAGLVLLLKGSPHRLRSRWMMALFVALLVPSVTRTRRMVLRVGYNIVVPSPRSLLLSSSSGADDMISATTTASAATTTTERSIGIDPLQHSHILSQISEWANSANSGGHPDDDDNNHHQLLSSALRFSFVEHQPDSWYKKDYGTNSALSLDYLSTSGVSSSSSSSNTSPNYNAGLIDELWKASDVTDSSVSTPWIDGAVGETWTTEAPWMILSSFVAGAWISEALLSSSLQSIVSTIPATTRLYLGWALPLATLLCGSYPSTEPLVATGPVWKILQVGAGLLGLKGEYAYHLWSVVGSVLLILSACFWFSSLSSSVSVFLDNHPMIMRTARRLLPQSVVDACSPVALSLFLVHLPILHSVTCGLFLFLHHYTDEVFWSAIMASALSVPFLLAGAVLFYQWMDRPVQVLSNKFSLQLLGVSTTTTTPTSLTTTTSSSSTTTGVSCLSHHLESGATSSNIDHYRKKPTPQPAFV